MKNVENQFDNHLLVQMFFHIDELFNFCWILRPRLLASFSVFYTLACIEEKKAKLNGAEQKYKREAMWAESERASEWAKRTRERGYCRIIPMARVKRELVVLSAIYYIISIKIFRRELFVSQCRKIS